MHARQPDRRDHEHLRSTTLLATTPYINDCRWKTQNVVGTRQLVQPDTGQRPELHGRRTTAATTPSSPSTAPAVVRARRAIRTWERSSRTTSPSTRTTTSRTTRTKARGCSRSTSRTTTCPSRPGRPRPTAKTRAAHSRPRLTARHRAPGDQRQSPGSVHRTVFIVPLNLGRATGASAPPLPAGRAPPRSSTRLRSRNASSARAPMARPRRRVNPRHTRREQHGGS